MVLQCDSPLTLIGISHFFLFCFQGERGLPGLKGETVSETFSENVTSRVHFFFFLTPSYLVMFRETQERMEHLANPGRQW